MTPKETAEAQIATILRDLELATECRVEALRLEDLETSNLDTPWPNREFTRLVVIELMRPAGVAWMQAT